MKGLSEMDVILKSWIKRLSGAAGVEYRLSLRDEATQRDLGQLAEQNAAIRSEIAVLAEENAALRRDLARIDQRLGHVSRFGVAAVWHAFDRIDALAPPSRLTCLACGTEDAAGAFAVKEDQCIFGGGRLVRYGCPRCGCVFGPTKYLNLPESIIDLDYTQLYAGYSESDSTEGEIRTFRALDPAKSGRYLNWGSGAWSAAIDRLRAEGYDVWGYEPNAEVDHPHVFRSREQVTGLFDGVFSHNVIEHLLDPARQFAEFSELLKPSGRMAHASPCYEWCYAFTRFHVFFPLAGAAEALANRSGYTVSSRIDDGDFRVRVFSRTA
jgi:SAM-dependent methyltransferase